MSLDALFSIPAHTGYVITLLATGGYMWLFDEAAARQANIDREIRDEVLGGGLHHPADDLDRNERLERGIAQAQTAGKISVAIGVLLGAALVWRLLA